MNAFFIKNRLHDYVDNQLSEETRAEIDKAIIEHPELLAELEALQAQRTQLLDHGSKAAPPNMMDDIWAQIEAEPIPRTRTTPANNTWMLWLGSVAVMLLAWWIIPHNDSTTQAESNSHHLLKGAQSLPAINPVALPKTSPIEEAIQFDDSRTPVVPVDDVPEEINLPPASTQKKSPSPKPVQTFVIQPPDTPYFPEYEQNAHIINVDETEHHIHDDAYFTFPLAAANILFDMDQLAEQLQGKLLSTKGVEISPYTLSAKTPTVSISLHIPVAQVSTAVDELRRLGGHFVGETIDEIDGFGVFKLHITYQNY